MKYRGRVKVTGKRQITLPAEICRDLGIVRGDELE
ncbi:MAG: AbrB/MazE/SpoVT family DNA-binding domain-containing protein, partial [Candidatus Sericytochromatia bacterium]|nr:AbrB/MazE/SpoVT family DNA-binding domain-containing protein [Candidatus Tanganyikabacteria bacterium]